jgi:hypothetical protein
MLFLDIVRHLYQFDHAVDRCELTIPHNLQIHQGPESRKVSIDSQEIVVGRTLVHKTYRHSAILVYGFIEGQRKPVVRFASDLWIQQHVFTPQNLGLPDEGTL